MHSHFPADSAGFCERSGRDYAACVFRLSPKAPSTALGILAALVVVGIGTGIVAALETIAEPVSLGIVFIPGVLLIATVWGLWLGIGTAVVSALAFNFFYLPPLRTFTIATPTVKKANAVSDNNDPMLSNSIANQALRQDLTADFQAKGYTLTTGSPSFAVS